MEESPSSEKSARLQTGPALQYFLFVRICTQGSLDFILLLKFKYTDRKDIDFFSQFSEPQEAKIIINSVLKIKCHWYLRRVELCDSVYWASHRTIQKNFSSSQVVSMSLRSFSSTISSKSRYSKRSGIIFTLSKETGYLVCSLELQNFTSCFK